MEMSMCDGHGGARCGMEEGDVFFGAVGGGRGGGVGLRRSGTDVSADETSGKMGEEETEIKQCQRTQLCPYKNVMLFKSGPKPFPVYIMICF